MKILFYVPYYPDKIRVRPYNLIRSLVESGHEIYVFTNGSESIPSAFPQDVSVEKFPLSQFQMLFNVGVGALQLGPVQFHYSWNPSLVSSLIEKISSGMYDVLHIEHLRGAKVGEYLRRQNIDIPIVWDSVDNISELFRLALKQNRSLLRKAITGFELFRTPTTETRLTKIFDRTAVTSDMDKTAFISGGASGDRISIIPNGIDLQHFSPRQVREEPKSIIMTGKMSYHANVSMVLKMIEDIMPLVWIRQPDTKLVIAGRDPSSEIMAYSQHPNIKITGEVVDMAAEINSAAIAAAPLKYAVGIQNKILEAMACAKPVITNSIGNRAIQAKNGRQILVAESDEEFAEFILQLLEDNQKRTEIGNEALTFVQEYFSWKKAAKAFVSLYQNAIMDTL